MSGAARCQCQANSQEEQGYDDMPLFHNESINLVLNVSQVARAAIDSTFAYLLCLWHIRLFELHWRSFMSQVEHLPALEARQEARWRRYLLDTLLAIVGALLVTGIIYAFHL